MKKKFLFMTLCFFTAFVSAQMGTTALPQPTGGIVFRYDDAGNQIYRGYYCSDCQVDPLSEPPAQPEDNRTAANASSEETFWSEVQIYPVPVKNILTIVWSDKADNLIDEVSLYEQNTIHWKFQQKNLPNLNKQVQIDMTNYYMGVYVLTFQLKDGRSISKNITKF